MGATLWYHDAPGHTDPSDALQALQARVLAREYDLHTPLPRRLLEARKTVVDVEADGDEYGLLDIYREQVRMLEEFTSRPIPRDPQAQIEILRRIEAYGGEGLGNVLDVEGISDARGFPMAHRLGEEDRCAWSGRPTRPSPRLAPPSPDPHRTEPGRERLLRLLRGRRFRNAGGLVLRGQYDRLTGRGDLLVLAHTHPSARLARRRRGEPGPEHQVRRQVEGQRQSDQEHRQPEPGRHPGLGLGVAQAVYIVEVYRQLGLSPVPAAPARGRRRPAGPRCPARSIRPGPVDRIPAARLPRAAGTAASRGTRTGPARTAADSGSNM